MSTPLVQQMLAILKRALPEKTAEIDSMVFDDDEVEAPKTTTIKVKERMEEMEKMLAENLELKKQIGHLNLQIEELTVAKTGLEGKETEREKALAAQAEQDKIKLIDAAIQKAIEGKKIPAKDEESISMYRKLLTADYESTNSILDKIPALQDRKEDLNNAQNQNSKPADIRTRATQAFLLNNN